MGESQDIPTASGSGVEQTQRDAAQSIVARPVIRPPEADHTWKFRIAFICLGLILVGALAGLVVAFVNSGSDDTAGGWSEWSPSASGDVPRAQAIADYVSVNYRLADGSQLVTVQAEAPVVQSIPVDFIAIKSSPDGTTYADANIPVFRDANSKGIQYLLCGLGEACSIPQGTPSTARQRLLRREALELALYTFRYVNGRDYVVVFMPPKPGERPTYALFFDKSDFTQELRVPLRETLPDPLALSASDIPPVETSVIDRLTNPHFFAFSYSQLQNQQVVLVLNDWHGVTPEPIQSSSSSSTSGSTSPTSTTSTDTTATTTTPATTTGS